MSAIVSLFEQTQLAETAYANFLDAAGKLITTDAQLIAALVASEFSKAQATAFVAEWEVTVRQKLTTDWQVDRNIDLVNNI